MRPLSKPSPAQSFSESPLAAPPPMRTLNFSPYMPPNPVVHHGVYTTPAAQMPHRMSAYEHYSPSMHPPPHLQPPHPSLTQNAANIQSSPVHFYGASLPPGPRPRTHPLYKISGTMSGL